MADPGNHGLPDSPSLGSSKQRAMWDPVPFTSLGHLRVSWEPPSEASPLLPSSSPSPRYSRRPTVASHRRRWSVVGCIALLTTTVLAILVLAFALPAIIKVYAQRATVFRIDSLTYEPSGQDWSRARIKGTFFTDADRVRSSWISGVGRLTTWIASEVETREGDTLAIYQPVFGHIVTVNASLPRLQVNVRNGHSTDLDFLSDIQHVSDGGSATKPIDWQDQEGGGILARANVHLRSGWLDLGRQEFFLTVQYKGGEMSSLVEAEVAGIDIPEPKDAMNWAGDVHTSVAVALSLPFPFTVPVAQYDVLLPGCSFEPYILAGQVGTTTAIEVRPGQPARVELDGHFFKFPHGLRKACSGDSLIGTLATGHPLDGTVPAYLRRAGPHDSVDGSPTLVLLKGDALTPVVSYLIDRSSSP